MRTSYDRPCFVADLMLGKLARYLRMLNYRCIYPSTSPSDEEIIRISKSKGCVLLTRDRYMCQKAKKEGVRCIFTPSKIEEALAILASEGLIDLKVPNEPLYCSICGGELKYVGTFPSRGKVWVCTKCGQPYWYGSHWKNIKKILERAIELKRDLVSRKGG